MFERSNRKESDMALKAGRVGVYPQDLDSTGHIRTQDPPEPYVLPVASESVLGGVKPVNKTEAMTQNVGVNSNGGLFTTPYTLPTAGENVLGGVKPVSKTEAMTQNVGVDSNGGLFTTPSSGTEIYYADFNMTRNTTTNDISTSSTVAKTGYTPIGCIIVSRYSGYSAYGSLYNAGGGTGIQVYGHATSYSTGSTNEFIARVYYMKGTPTQLT